MRRGLLVLSGRDVARLIDIRAAIRIVRRAFIAHAEGGASMPSKVYLTVPRGDFRAMPAAMVRPASCGIKWVNVHPANPRRGLPTVMAMILLNDPATGAPLAVMDGLLITKFRTAAAGAVAAARLSPRTAATVGLVGCGAQADAQLDALKAVRPIRTVNVWGYRPGEARAFCARAARRLGLALRPVPTVEACVRGAELVVTLTPSRRPLIRRSWLSPGAHVNAIGADAPGKQELDPAILRDAVVVVDERAQAIHGGEVNVPIRRGQFHPGRIAASLGELLAGRIRLRRRPGQLSVFDSTGLAIHDLALAQAVLARARRRRIGRWIPW